MTLNSILRQKNMTMYRLAKASSVPYTTVSDLCSGKTRIEKCSAETLYRLAKALDMTMEAMVADQLIPRCGFELFKSNVCHRLKEMGDLPFLEETLGQNAIRTYYDRGWYPETTFEVGIVKTIDWYLEHTEWMERVTSGAYQKYYEEMYKNR